MSQEDLEATGKQRSKIAKLSTILGIPTSIEGGPLTMAQAGKQIRHLSIQLKLRKNRKSIVDIFKGEYKRRLR